MKAHSTVSWLKILSNRGNYPIKPALINYRTVRVAVQNACMNLYIASAEGGSAAIAVVSITDIESTDWYHIKQLHQRSMYLLAL